MKIFCKHDFEPHGFNYIKCSKCGRTRLNRSKNVILMKAKIKKWIDDGLYTREELIYIIMRGGYN